MPKVKSMRTFIYRTESDVHRNFQRLLSGECPVHDIETTEGSRRGNRINLDDKYELAYWSKTLGVSEEQLRAVVARVGDSVEAVALEIERKKAA